MHEPINSESAHLALEIGSSLFAIPICDTRGIVIGTNAMQPTVLPQMPDYVKCVATVHGQITTIITLSGDITDVQLLGKPIVILAHPERTIGVVANSVKLVTIPKESISVDCLTGAKTYAESSNIFSIIDTKELFMDKERGV